MNIVKRLQKPMPNSLDVMVAERVEAADTIERLQLTLQKWQRFCETNYEDYKQMDLDWIELKKLTDEVIQSTMEIK